MAHLAHLSFDTFRFWINGRQNNRQISRNVCILLQTYKLKYSTWSYAAEEVGHSPSWTFYIVRYLCTRHSKLLVKKLEFFSLHLVCAPVCGHRIEISQKNAIVDQQNCEKYNGMFSRFDTAVHECNRQSQTDSHLRTIPRGNNNNIIKIIISNICSAPIAHWT